MNAPFCFGVLFRADIMYSIDKRKSQEAVFSRFLEKILMKKFSFALTEYGSSRFVFRFFGSLERARRSRAH